MKLSRNTLRSLAVGFLASAVVTAAFALSQGQLPVQGVNGTNLLNGGSTTANADQQAQLDALSSEKSALESTQNVLNASLTSLKEQASRQSSELEALKSHSASSASNESSSSSSESLSSSESDQANNQAETGQEQNNGTSTEGTSAPRNGQWTTEGGNFTVNPGDTSEDVAQNLYDAGIISSPDVFLEVVDQWDLSTLLIAGTYELNSGMNVNTIAEILTNGAYYWIP